jgi:CheY-like chemotaxis protein
LGDQELVEDLVIDDDRNLIRPGDPVLLIVEDDIVFARILVDLAHERGLKALVAIRGSSALSLAREFKPGAITLDINLPDITGWTFLDRLKHDPAIRHIPVHIISGDENRRFGLALGAMTYLEKSVTNDSLADAFRTIEDSTQKRLKKLLVVCPDRDDRDRIVQIVGGPDLEVVEAGAGGEALAIVGQQYLDAIVIHLGSGSIGPLPLVEEIQALAGAPVPPVIVWITRTMTSDEEIDLARLMRTSIVKITHSPERLLDESVLLLHRTEADLSPDQRHCLEELRQTDLTLAGKKVLVVDDDVRNIFALASLLEDHRLKVVHAENGRAGIELLARTPDVDLVLMDIMMPEMDGYETMKAIRHMPEFRSLPIIALTAKAMKGDRAKCIEAGASDYIMKPVDMEQLFSVLRVWISRGRELKQTAALGVG